MTQNDYFKNYLKKEKIKCDCGGPQSGTNHSPDCSIEIAWENAMDEYEEKYIYNIA